MLAKPSALTDQVGEHYPTASLTSFAAGRGAAESSQTSCVTWVWPPSDWLTTYMTPPVAKVQVAQA